jgi:redox-sensitive bicupin YhaK (pirin superfamily)
LLPKRARRTVGAWCFLDHFGPSAPEAGPDGGMRIGPHLHIGLQTVTWLVEGEVLHRDSLGSEQLIRPDQLNLMTAGHGVAHSEEPGPAGPTAVHGAQLWVAQPSSTRHGPPAFEHHATLPQAEDGDAVATVLVGELAGVRSPARTDTPLVGAAIRLGSGRGGGGRTTLPLDRTFEHALVVLQGAATIGADAPLGPGELAYLGTGLDELVLTAAGHDPVEALLLGGAPFGEELVMWWNFVARSREEIADARGAWQAGDDRFGEVRSALARIEAPAL